MRLWNVDTGENIRTLNGHTDCVMSVSFSPDGKYICSGSDDKTVRLWNVDTGKHVRTLNGHTNNVWSVSFSPDGKYICSGSFDKTVRLWNVGEIIKKEEKIIEEKIIEEKEKKETLETYFREENNILTNSITQDIISDPHIASDGMSYTPDGFKDFFKGKNNTFTPHSPITQEPLEKINPEAPEYYKKFLRKNVMLSDVLEYIAKKEKKK